MRTVAVASFLMAAILAVHSSGQSTALRVACRAGQPPFNSDTVSETTGKHTCDGLFADLFFTVASRIGLNYTLSFPGSADPSTNYVNVNSTTNTSRFDIVIAYHTITPARLAIHDFSVAVMENDYSIVLQPSFAKPSGDIGSVIINQKSVLYVFSIFALEFAFMTIVILIFEPHHEESDIHPLPWWRRFLWALEMGVETVFTSSTSEDVASQVTRTFRSIVACAGIFILAIFGAVITSQLTAASLATGINTIDELSNAGNNFATASSTLNDYVTLKMRSTLYSGKAVPNINAFAAEFFAGNHSDVQGFIAATDIVNYLYNLNGGADNGFVISEPFRLGGTMELRGYPFSRTVNQSVRIAFDTQLQSMRDNGELAALLSKYVAPADSAGDPDDIPLKDSAVTAMFVLVGVIFGGLVLTSAILFIRTNLFGGADAEAEDESEHPTLEWKGQIIHNLSPEDIAVLDAIAEYLQKQAD